MAEVISPNAAHNFNANQKRVSFGENPVKTFLYEKEDDSTPILARQPYTDVDAPVARVTVFEQETVDIPIAPILPPRNIEGDQRRPVSPPLPWARKMENEHENPFRPEEHLYHEVDPIVEAYLHKPFPPSHPGSADGTPVKANGNGHAVSSSPSYLQNGLSKEQLMQNEKMQPLLSEAPETPVRRQSDKPLGATMIDGKEDDFDNLPPAGQVELVHIKKKKCGCCSLQ
ncbi:hypothetical protein PENTCL1PPCAC_21905 [Pristionchus entomophagus]|uniref:Uncharacterized protein n=1 Tax=Pristionchus entomophagus TaxID=358040 RepID=A0AAV5TYU9_9BILA|nr:hypothetical protein PENTCL1PPCAC_21905 [Pristionchus entomophagus]